MAGFLRSARGGVSPCLPHPSHDSQLSRLAIAITIPVSHVAKAKNSTKSVRIVGIPTPPLASPCWTHPDTPWDCPWSDTRHKGQNLQAIDVKTLWVSRRTSGGVGRQSSSPWRHQKGPWGIGREKTGQ